MEYPQSKFPIRLLRSVNYNFSPYSTHMGSRRNSHHPSAEGLFDSIKEEIPSTNPMTLVEEKVKEKSSLKG